jgi:hypothetical protein
MAQGGFHGRQPLWTRHRYGPTTISSSSLAAAWPSCKSPSKLSTTAAAFSRATRPSFSASQRSRPLGRCRFAQSWARLASSSLPSKIRQPSPGCATDGRGGRARGPTDRMAGARRSRSQAMMKARIGRGLRRKDQCLQKGRSPQTLAC